MHNYIPFKIKSLPALPFLYDITTDYIFRNAGTTYKIFYKENYQNIFELSIRRNLFAIFKIKHIDYKRKLLKAEIRKPTPNNKLRRHRSHIIIKLTDEQLKELFDFYEEIVLKYA